MLFKNINVMYINLASRTDRNIHVQNELKKIERDIDTNRNHYNVVSELTDLDSDSSVQSEESVTCGVVAENEPEDEICSK